MGRQAAVHQLAQRWQQKTTLGDKLATTVFLCGGLFLLWYELCCVAAFNHTDWSLGYTAHGVVVLFFAANIYSNWVMAFVTMSTGVGVVFPAGPTPPGWRYCGMCEANRPPRSHHCFVCKTCTLKHDHHCWFTGACIGHDNQRYFFALCVHMLLAGVYCNLYNWNFVCDVKGGNILDFYNVLSFIFPHLTAFLGRETWLTFMVSSVTMLGLGLTVTFVWLCHSQVMQMTKGQTRYERKRGVREYDQGLGANVEEVLGHRRLLVLLWPWLTSTLPGDGITYYSQSQKVC